MRIATWNVNSIKARLPGVVDWLREAGPDVVLFQEIKCETEAFPASFFEDIGYKVAAHGQKAYNGVAILAKAPLAEVSAGLPGDPADTQARYLEAVIGGVRVVCLYLPNGNPVDGSGKYDYKLRWMARLRWRVAELLEAETPFVLGGDFNVIPAAEDVYDPAGWAEDALFRLETRAAFRSIVHLGLTDAYRALHPAGTGAPAYTFWDYQAGCWPRDQGLRIDHFLLSPQTADRLAGCTIDRAPRGRDKASDHTPVVLELRP